MKRLFAHLSLATLTLSLTLALGCAEDDDPGAELNLSQAELTEDAAVTVGESVALESGGLLEALEATLDNDVDSQGDALPVANPKDARLDEAVFDSTTCRWTITRARSHESEHGGFTWLQTRTLHFMDEAGACVVQRGDSSIRALDFTREYSGSSWNPRREGEKNGGGAWELRGLHDAEPGTWVNGGHHEQGESVIHRVRPNGEAVDVTYEYTLSAEGTDLLILHRNGRRVPVAGTLHVVYDALRNGHAIHREFTITFGEGGGSLTDGETAWNVDPVTGSLSR
jgi:hypothetical protein